MWLEDLSRDLRYALRTLRKSLTFTTTAAATPALAIGTNTAMFSVLDAVLLRPLPCQSPEQLAMLWTEDPTQNLREGRSALGDVEQWRGQSQTFAAGESDASLQQSSPGERTIRYAMEAAAESMRHSGPEL